MILTRENFYVYKFIASTLLKRVCLQPLWEIINLKMLLQKSFQGQFSLEIGLLQMGFE